MSAIDLFCFDRCMAVSRFGIAMAARMPMIATTIRSSIRVKPFCFLVIHVLLDAGFKGKRHAAVAAEPKRLYWYDFAVKGGRCLTQFCHFFYGTSDHSCQTLSNAHRRTTC